MGHEKFMVGGSESLQREDELSWHIEFDILTTTLVQKSLDEQIY